MCLMQAMVPVKLVDHIVSVKTLAVAMPEMNLKLMVDYLRCFPCLEKLHIKVPITNPCLLFCCYILEVVVRVFSLS
jgi:hypothetical protein